MPTCCDCRRPLEKSAFAKSQLKKPASARRCLVCASSVSSAAASTAGENASTHQPTGQSRRNGSGNRAEPAPTRASESNGGGGTRTAAMNSRVGGAAAGGATPPIEPGRKAIIKNLASRTDLNGTVVMIVGILRNGRVAVEITHMGGTSLARAERVAIKPENLEVVWGTDVDTGVGGQMHNWGIEAEECPICRDTMMNTGLGSGQTASIFSCCGGKMCHKCFVKTQLGPDPDRCPLCQADTSDTSDAAELRKIRARADRGDPSAMYNLGGFYDYGKYGLRQDQKLARVWYEKAAVKGHSRAANNLACSHRDGEGGPVDSREAAKWFRVAAELGHVQAATNLGLALMRGDGVKLDLEEAEKWLRKSAKAGDELAVQQLEFLDMMKNGDNVMPFGSGGNVMFSFGR